MVERLQSEIAQLKVRNEELEASYTERKNYEMIVREKEEFRVKTKELSKAINRLTRDSISRTDYDKLTEQVTELEAVR
jgi:hypothetical protein